MLSNNPPDGDALTLRLGEIHASLQERADELLSAVERVPDVLDADTFDRAAALAKQIALHVATVDETRVEEKAPFLTGGRIVDRFFGGISLDLSTGAERIKARVAAYLAGSGEAKVRTVYGVTASRRETVDFQIVDHIAAVCTLASYIDAEAVAKAARAWVRDHKADAELLIKDQPDAAEHIKGVRLFFNQTARVA